MSESSDQAAFSGPGGAAAPAGVSAGAVIRRAREQAGVHIAALAVSLKVPVKRLEALEADRYDQLPDLVFARALALSLCRSLKLDPERVLPLLPQGPAQKLSVEGPINEPFRPDSQMPTGRFGAVSRPAVLAAAALVVAAAAVYIVPLLMGQDDSPPAAPAAPVAAPAETPAAAPPGPGVPATVIEPAPSAAPAAAPGSGAPAAASPGLPGAPAAPAMAPAPAVVPVPVPSQPASR